MWPFNVFKRKREEQQQKATRNVIADQLALGRTATGRFRNLKPSMRDYQPRRSSSPAFPDLYDPFSMMNPLNPLSPLNASRETVTTEYATRVEPDTGRADPSPTLDFGSSTADTSWSAPSVDTSSSASDPSPPSIDTGSPSADW